LPEPSFKLSLQAYELEFIVTGLPKADAATFVDRNLVPVRITVTGREGLARVIEDTVYTGAFVRFSSDLDTYVAGTWYPTPREAGDPLWKRDAVILRMSGGQIGLTCHGGHSELTCFVNGHDEAVWRLPLHHEQVRRLQSRVDGLAPIFSPRATLPVISEPAADAVHRVTRFIEEVVDESGYFIRVDALRQRGWGAVQCLKYWLKSDVVRTGQLLDALSRHGSDLLVFSAIPIDVPQVARVPATLDGLVGFLADVRTSPVDNLVITSIGGDFVMLVTHEDHLIVAGPPPTILEGFEGFLHEVRLNLRRHVLRSQPGHPEAANAAIIANQDQWLQRDLAYVAPLALPGPAPG
jgi:hypothetical protein